MRVIIIICSVALLTGCLSEPGGGSSGSTSKSLFSVWQSDAEQESFNLTESSFTGESAMAIGDYDNNSCICIVTFETGSTESAGAILWNDCIAYQGATTDQACAGLNSSAYEYTKTSTTLTMCTLAGLCYDYR